MHFFARSFGSASEAQAAHEEIITVLDGIDFDSYSIAAASDGVEIVVVGIQQADALLDADLPRSWLAAPGYWLTAETVEALRAMRSAQPIAS